MTNLYIYCFKRNHLKWLEGEMRPDYVKIKLECPYTDTLVTVELLPCSRCPGGRVHVGPIYPRAGPGTSSSSSSTLPPPTMAAYLPSMDSLYKTAKGQPVGQWVKGSRFKVSVLISLPGFSKLQLCVNSVHDGVTLPVPPDPAKLQLLLAGLPKEARVGASTGLEFRFSVNHRKVCIRVL